MNPSAKSRPFYVGVAGGGIVASLSKSMSKPPPSEVGAGVSIYPQGRRVQYILGWEEDEETDHRVHNLGQNGVHRAHFLELVKLVPREIAQFNKWLEGIQEIPGDEKLVLKFADGAEEEADAVIGCDGIKSRVRQILVGENHPSAHPSFTHKYAHRGLVPMDKAIEAIGDELASNSCMHACASSPPTEP